METSLSNRIKAYSLCVFSTIAISACSDSSDSPDGKVDGDFQAVITAVSSDSGSSEISLANTVVADDITTEDVDESETSYDVVNGYAAQDLSDIRAVTYGENFYRLGRSSQDHITKYSFDEPNVEQWQYSINDEGGTDANPHDLVFVSEEKAYVIRWGASSILIVNPSVGAGDEEGFRVGEIDLSAYDLDGVPNMHRALIHDGVLYVVIQALDSSYIPRESYLVAIDTVTDEEINIGASLLKGLALNVRNPIDLDIYGNDLYVSAIGRYGASYLTPPRAPEYTGGIEKISLIDYSSQILIDDGNATIHPYGQVNGLTVVSDTVAYFLGYHGWKNISLYRFNPSTGVVVETALTDLDGVDVRALETSPEGQVWVGVGSDTTPQIKVLDPEDDSVIASIDLDKIPSDIAFSSDLAEN